LTQSVGTLTFDCQLYRCLLIYFSLHKWISNVIFFTPIPSSAAVERLVSVAGLVRTAKLNRMSDHVQNIGAAESKLVVQTTDYRNIKTNCR